MASPQDTDTLEPLGYRQESAQPLVSLAFITPILLGYEAGVLWLGPEAMRNGADIWLRSLLELAGFGQYFLLPIATCAILLAWHHLTHHRWRVSPPVVAGMALESALWAVGLVGLARIQRVVFLVAIPPMRVGTAESAAPPFVSYLGAGVYEELLFRLMLLPLLVVAVRAMGASQTTAIGSAVLTSSLLFSAAHYDIFTSVGEPFEIFSFVFRFIAGVVFALLFVKRGFGIAAGTHALYDLMTISAAK